MIVRPRVGLNAQLLSGSASYRSAGIHQYIDRLLRHLPALGGDIDYIAFTNPQAHSAVEGMRVQAARWPTHRPAARIAWEQLVLPLAARRAGLHVLHGLAFVLPLVRPCKTVVTVYDLSFALFPDLFRGANAAYLRLFARLSCRAAERVIAISDSTRNDVARLYGVPEERISVARPGVDAHFRPLPQAQVAAFRRQRNLPNTFILHVGTLEPRKNHITLLKALAQLANLQPPTSNLQLVCVGGQGWRYDEIYAAVERLGLRQQVIFAGYVPAEELPWWYNAATLFVYPSLYEGFGMPVLEALACGAPVIASDVSSLPEAAGPAGALVAPRDVEGLAAALRQLLADPDRRGQMRQAGLAHAAGFTWEQTARATLATFRRVLSG